MGASEIWVNVLPISLKNCQIWTMIINIESCLNMPDNGSCDYSSIQQGRELVRRLRQSARKRFFVISSGFEHGTHGAANQVIMMMKVSSLR